MFHPTLTICGYHSGYGGEGARTSIPCKVKVKIDMRLVKDQKPQDIFRKFKRHMEKHGFGDLDLKFINSYTPFRTSIEHPMAKALIAAVQKTFKKDPIIIPVSGGSVPTCAIPDFLGIPLFGVPYASHDECNHAPNENLVIDLFLTGIKTSASVFYELGRL